MSTTSSQARPRTDGVPQRLQRRAKPSEPFLVTRESEVGARQASRGASEAHLSPNTMAYAKDRPGRRYCDYFNRRVGRSPRRFVLAQSYRCVRSMRFAAVKVARLRLSDFDWRDETFVVQRSKRGGLQHYPIQYEVGETILRYLRNGRPHYSCRHVFVTLHPPYRPLQSGSLWQIVSRALSSWEYRPGTRDLMRFDTPAPPTCLVGGRL